MRNALLHEAGSGAGETPDYPITVVRPGEYRTRQIDAAKALFSATGVKREDLAARQESFLGNFRFFGAPHVAFLSMRSEEHTSELQSLMSISYAVFCLKKK